MKLRKTGRGWTVSSAPIEFVLVGPRMDDDERVIGRPRSAERDAVLIRTANLRPDLLALAIESRAGDFSSINALIERAEILRTAPSAEPSRFALGVPDNTGKLRKLSAVRSELDDRAGERTSNYVFAWAGEVDHFGKDIMKTTLLRYLADLKAGLRDGDSERIEWALAPIIYHCMLVTTSETRTPDKTREFARQARMNSYFSLLVAAMSLFFVILSMFSLFLIKYIR